MNTLTPGWKTSEFWGFIAIMIVNYAVQKGVLPQANASDTVTLGTDMMVAIVSFGSYIYYAMGRNSLKSKQIDCNNPTPTVQG